MSAVLDASAVLAYLKDEPGGDAVEEALVSGAHISAANWAEVLSKIAEEGDDPALTVDRFEREGVLGRALILHPLDGMQALEIARLRSPTREAGLSLADRACLALAATLELSALTADRAWTELEVGVRVALIR